MFRKKYIRIDREKFREVTQRNLGETWRAKVEE
jgi:hypothetical protein